jgi:hypothetical protein
MRALPLVAAVAVAACLGGCGSSGPTGVQVTLEGAGISVDGLTVDVALPGGGAMTQQTQLARVEMTPLRVAAELPIDSGVVTLTVTGMLAGRVVAQGTSGSVTLRAHQLVPATVPLSGAMMDAGPGGGDAAVDLARAPCGDAGAGCYDVSATLSAFQYPADSTATRVFGVAPTVGQPVYALLNTEDNSYQTFVESATCGSRTRAKSWFIERKANGANSWRILVRGQSGPDCPNGNALFAGQLSVNKASGWRLGPVSSCFVDSDSKGRPIFCQVDFLAGTVSWQAGAICGSCCGCADGGGVSIDVVLVR